MPFFLTRLKILLLFFLVLVAFSQDLKAKNSHCSHSSYIENILKKTVNRAPIIDDEIQLSYFNGIDDKVHIRGKSIFRKMKTLIKNAKQNVFFQTWLFHAHSDPAHHLFSSLKSLQDRVIQSSERNPVNVWLLINVLQIKSKTRMHNDIERMIAKYNLSSKYLNIRVGIWNAKGFAALHSKYLVVDNHLSIVTGVNSTDDNNDVSGNFDLGFSLNGKIAQNIAKDFVSKWNRSISLKKCSFQENDLCWFKSDVLTELKPLRKPGMQFRCLPMLLIKTPGQSNPFANYIKSAKKIAFLEAIRSAKKYINIITPNLNVPLVIDELVAAVKRGVKVKIVLSLRHMVKAQNLPTRGGSNLRSVEKLYFLSGLNPFTRSRVCKGLQIKWYSNNGINAVNGFNPPFSHAKYMNIDNSLTLIGSSNLDNQSWINSYELDVVVDSKFVTNKWKKQIFSSAFSKAIKVSQCGGPEQ